ncbi:MAG: hypothetical protein H7227_06415 [Actinobacteria bacterium]|nr:hypothetical protein [Actinomycetota bacterium]
MKVTTDVAALELVVVTARNEMASAIEVSVDPDLRIKFFMGSALQFSC